MKNELVEEANERFNNLIKETIDLIEVERKKCFTKINDAFKDRDAETIIADYNKVSRREELALFIRGEERDGLAGFFAEMTSK